MRIRVFGSFLLMLSLLGPVSAHAEEEAALPKWGLREWGINVAGGVNPSNDIQYYALQPYVGFPLWESADRWLAERNVTGRWIIEPWVALVDDQKGPYKTTSFEIGVSPLFARATFLADHTFRPFIDGGLGILYTDLRGQDLSTRIQFSSQIGVGLEYELNPSLSLSLTARLRHISNAGLGSSNPGINTIYGMLGVTFR